MLMSGLAMYPSRGPGGPLPIVTVTDYAEEEEELCILNQNRIDAQDMNDLRRMTCPAGQLCDDCPNLKALAASCRQQQLCKSSLEIHSTMRRHSDDVDGRGRAYWLKLAKSHLIGGYQTLKARLSPTSRDLSELYDIGRRQLTVEFLTHDNNKRKCKSSEDVSCLISRRGSNIDVSKELQHNMSSCLAINSLKEGRLTAAISLRDCPANEDVIVRVCNYTLEILTMKRVTPKKSSTGSKGKDAQNWVPIKCGQIDIPIYVDPGTLYFELVDDETLLMEGNTKSCIPRPKCHSQEELTSRSKSPSPRSRSPFERRQSNATWFVNGQSDRPGFFRQRSYTR